MKFHPITDLGKFLPIAHNASWACEWASLVFSYIADHIFMADPYLNCYILNNIA